MPKGVYKHKKGWKHSKITREKLSLAKVGEKNPMFGKPSWNKKKRKLVYCSCGCGENFIDVNVAGITRRFLHGHNKPWLGKKRLDMIGVNNFSWRGNDAGKSAMHNWVERQRGKPKKCEMCGDTKRRFYDWANIDHKYKRKLEDYIRLCRSCHRKRDIKYNNLLNNNKSITR